MTGSDLIVLVPWIAFAVGLAAIGLLLLRSRRASGSWSGPADQDPASRPNPQESKCPEQNAEARPQ